MASRPDFCNPLIFWVLPLFNNYSCRLYSGSYSRWNVRGISKWHPTCVSTLRVDNMGRCLYFNCNNRYTGWKEYQQKFQYTMKIIERIELPVLRWTATHYHNTSTSSQPSRPYSSSLLVVLSPRPQVKTHLYSNWFKVHLTYLHHLENIIFSTATLLLTYPLLFSVPLPGPTLIWQKQKQ